MNRVDQISTQNLQDCLSILYKNLAKSLIYVHGKQGQVALREATHLYGRKIGALERERHLQSGLKPNLKTLYETPLVSAVDPRFRVEWQLFNEEEAVYDIITCPFYDYMRKTDAADLCLPYCEECCLGSILAYTNDCGQANLGEMLLRRGENSCRFGCYYRPSNVDAAERERCFSAQSADEAPPPSPKTPDENPVKAFTELARLLLSAFTQTLERHYGEDGLRVVSEGLKGAADETVSFMYYRNDAVGYDFDRHFLDQNCIWSLELADGHGLDQTQERLVRINFCRNLKSGLARFLKEEK
jgi:hypothetical protein